MVALIDAEVYATRTLRAPRQAPAQRGESHSSKHTKTGLPTKASMATEKFLKIRRLLEEQQQVHRRIDN
jgi:hypothetical protein